MVVNSFFQLDLFLLRLENVVKVLFKDHHLLIIRSIESTEVDLLFLSLSLDIVVCFLEDEVLVWSVWIDLWLIQRVVKLSSSWVGANWVLTCGSELGLLRWCVCCCLGEVVIELFISEVLKLVALKLWDQWGLSRSRKDGFGSIVFSFWNVDLLFNEFMVWLMRRGWRSCEPWSQIFFTLGIARNFSDSQFHFVGPWTFWRLWPFFLLKISSHRIVCR